MARCAMPARYTRRPHPDRLSEVTHSNFPLSATSDLRQEHSGVAAVFREARTKFSGEERFFAARLPVKLFLPRDRMIDRCKGKRWPLDSRFLFCAERVRWRYEAGRNTSEGVRNCTLGSSVTTRMRSKRPFFPPRLESKVNRYWLFRCSWISSRYGLKVTGTPNPR